MTVTDSASALDFARTLLAAAGNDRHAARGAALAALGRGWECATVCHYIDTTDVYVPPQPSARERLLAAVDAAGQAEQDYLADRITYRAYARAMDHLVVCRDAAHLSFLSPVRLPERALPGGV